MPPKVARVQLLTNLHKSLRTTQLNRKRVLFFWLPIVYGLWVGALLLATAGLAFLLKQSLQQGNISLIAKYSTQANVSLTLLDYSTLGIVPDLGFARQVTALPKDNYPFLLWLDQLRVDPFLPTESPLSPKTMEDLVHDVLALETGCNKTWLIKHFPQQLCQKLATGTKLIKDFAPHAIDHLEKDYTYIILFQNSDELRAGGGFMGSYAKIVVGAQGLSYLDIQDIYEPDGQFRGFVPAPKGLEEYLSSGQGMRLPDANWYADFSESSKRILHYFSRGNEQSVDGVIAINSHLVEQLLTITGDVYLPDSNTNVSATNFSSLARADRDQFFPGSKQKQHFLSSFMTQLKLRLADLSPQQQRQLLSLWLNSIASKDVMLYSNNPELQQKLVDYKMAGILGTEKDSPLFYLLESNVGINKSNKLVERQIEVSDQTTEPQRTESTVTINISWQNNNPSTPPADSPDKNLDYINYQRVITPMNWHLMGITFNNQPVTEVNSYTTFNHYKGVYREFGFLAPVAAKSTASATITFTVDEPLPNTFTIVKQPGLSPTPYALTWLGTQRTLVLDHDILISTNPNL